MIDRLTGLIQRTSEVIDFTKKVFEQEFKTWKKSVRAEVKISPPKGRPKANKKREGLPKITRKISVRSGKQINSERSTQILKNILETDRHVLSSSAQIKGKKSLAQVLWALQSAEKAKIEDGLSIHDVSSLVYQATQTELYPINVSLMVHGNTQFIRPVESKDKTKRYALTEEGSKLAAKLPLQSIKKIFN